MAAKRATLLWGLRLLLLVAVAWILSRQIHWEDELLLRDGTVVLGRATESGDGGFDVRLPDGTHLHVPAADVAQREDADEPVPAVSWGLATLFGRLGAAWPQGLLVHLLLAALLVLTSFRWWLLLRAVELDVRFPRALRLGWIGAFFNLAVPGSTGGDVVKAWYAARSTGRPTRSVLSVFVDRAAGMLGLGVLAGLALVLQPPSRGFGAARVLVLLLVGVCVVVALLLAVPGLRRRLGLHALGRRLPFAGVRAEVSAAGALYGRRRGALLVALALSVLNHAGAAVAVWLLARALGVEGVHLTTAVVLVPLANLFSALPVVPGGWGVGELAFAYLFGQVGVPPTEAVSLSVLYRLGLLIVSVPGAWLWIVWKDRPTKASIARDLEAAPAGGPALEGLDP